MIKKVPMSKKTYQCSRKFEQQRLLRLVIRTREIHQQGGSNSISLSKSFAHLRFILVGGE
jgi:hypothetical protein